MGAGVHEPQPAEGLPALRGLTAGAETTTVTSKAY